VIHKAFVDGELEIALIENLAEQAWEARENALLTDPKKGTKVGAALLSLRGSVFTGCNAQHRFRVGEIHAERAAISAMISAEGPERFKGFNLIAIVAERESFTPCGLCLDWIYEMSGGDVKIGVQAERGGPIKTYSFDEIMKIYPR